MVERVDSFRFISPMRCRDCKARFITKTVVLKDLRFARCPKCHRMDLNGWTGKTWKPGSWLGFKVRIGAHRWRCEYCRLNFGSFRPRKEPFTFNRWKKRDPEGVAEIPAVERRRHPDPPNDPQQ